MLHLNVHFWGRCFFGVSVIFEELNEVWGRELAAAPSVASVTFLCGPLPQLEDTLNLVKRIEKTGIAAIAVHGR